MMGEWIDLVFHIRVIVEGIAVEVTEFKSVSLQGRTKEWSGYVGFHQASSSEYDETLYLLDKQNHIPIIYFFPIDMTSSSPCALLKYESKYLTSAWFYLSFFDGVSICNKGLGVVSVRDVEEEKETLATNIFSIRLWSDMISSLCFAYM